VQGRRCSHLCGLEVDFHMDEVGEMDSSPLENERRNQAKQARKPLCDWCEGLRAPFLFQPPVDALHLIEQ
jgi:hypothetical protein